MEDAAETPVAKYIKVYGSWGAEILALWLPGAGIAGKLIEKAPLEDLEKWLRGRAPGGQVDVSEPVAVATNTVAGNDDPAPAAVPLQQQPPAPAALEVDDLLRQYKEAQESEPFRAALANALQSSVAGLESFMQQTTRFDGFGDSANGLWPAFALEWKLRRSLRNKLGPTAIVNDYPALTSLVEVDLAAGLIDTIMGPLGGSAKQPKTLKHRVRIFAASEGYRWPGAEGLRRGYVMANVTSPYSPNNLRPVSNFGRAALAKAAPPSGMDEAKLEEDGTVLVSRLGGLSNCGRDELTRAWLRSCVAGEMSEEQRKASGMAPNPLLSRLQHPLIHIDDKDLLEGIRDDVDAILGAPEPTQQYIWHNSLYAKLDTITQAFAINDADGFDEAITSINASLLLASHAPQTERVWRVIERLKRARGWA